MRAGPTALFTALFVVTGCQCGAERTAATRPTLEVAPASLDFGRVATGMTADRVLTLTNARSAPLTLAGLGVQDDANAVFSLAGALPTTLEGGGSVTVTVRYSAGKVARQESGRLRIASDAENARELFVPLLAESFVGCVPEGEGDSCRRAGFECGDATLTDNCGATRTVHCGGCANGTTCGALAANRCGCVAEKDADFCARLKLDCGTVTAKDNCGVSRTATCGTCTAPESCGGAGTPNVCGCTAEGDADLCAAQKLDCGTVMVMDRCGEMRTPICGSCTAPESCGGGGTVNVCGCTPESDTDLCSRLGLDCDQATVSDNCRRSRTVSCGSCSSPKTCGGGGKANVCGCTPETDAAFCARLGATCDPLTAADNCGATRTVSCGSCGAGLVCGATKPNVCSVPDCTWKSRFQELFKQAWNPADVGFLMSDGSVRHGMSQLDLNAQRNQIPDIVKCTGSTATVREIRLYASGSSTQVLASHGPPFIYGLGDAMWHQVNGYAASDFVETTLIRLFDLEVPTYVQLVSALRACTKSAESQVPAGDLADFRTAADRFVTAVESGALTFAVGTGHGLDFNQTRQSVNGKTFSFQYSTAYGFDPYIGFQREGTGAWGPAWNGAAPLAPKCGGCIVNALWEGKRYEFCDGQKTWSDARAFCRAQGGKLASIPDVYTSGFLRSLSPNAGDTFIGLSDQQTEGSFVWDGGGAVSWTRWGQGQPDDWMGSEDCGELYDFTPRLTQWNDLSCAAARSFLCELP